MTELSSTANHTAVTHPEDGRKERKAPGCRCERAARPVTLGRHQQRGCRVDAAPATEPDELVVDAEGDEGDQESHCDTTHEDRPSQGGVA